MLANSQWNTRYERVWWQFDHGFFGLTSSGLGGRLLVDLNGSENSSHREDLGGRILVDLNSNPGRTENSCHWEDLDLYVDLPFSPLGESGDEKAQSVFEERALSMETGRTVALDSEAAGAMPSFSADSHTGKVSQDFLTCVSNLQSTCARLEDDNAVLGCEICCPSTAEMDKPMAFERIRNTSVEASIVTLPLDQSPIEIKGKNQENSFHPTTIDCSKENSKKADTTRLGKRPCEFSEVQNSKQRKVAHASRTSAKDNSRLPVRVGERSSSSSLHVQKEAQKGKEAVGVDTKAKSVKDTGTLLKSTDWSTRAGVQSSAVVEDISREEAAVEFQQCVSLLRKYGVLRTEEYLLSQNLPSSVPHPGYVGDGLLSKVCKVCGAPEDASNTVICDECQEVFHLTCCIPRLSSKFFDREDDWYCSSCRKQKKKIGSKLTENSSGSGSLTSFRVSENGFIDSSGKVHSVATSYNSKVRLGQAHQVDVPLWPGKVMDEDLECCFADRPGLEVPLSQQDKDMEKERILKSFNEKVQSLNWLPANMLPDGTVENWLKCQNIVRAAYKDSDGKKHSEVKCGKWRRAPLDVKQSDNWECFCVMAWDPLRADCAVPQELPNEEIFKRIHTKPDDQASEILNKQIS